MYFPGDPRRADRSSDVPVGVKSSKMQGDTNGWEVNGGAGAPPPAYAGGDSGPASGPAPGSTALPPGPLTQPPPPGQGMMDKKPVRRIGNF